MAFPFDGIHLEPESENPQVHLEDETTGGEYTPDIEQDNAHAEQLAQDESLAGAPDGGKPVEPVKSKRRASRSAGASKPVVPVACVRQLHGIVEALEGGYVPLARLLADTGSGDVMTLASALTEAKPRKRVHEFVQLVQRFDADADADRRTDIALEMLRDKELARLLFTMLAVMNPGEDIGRAGGAGREAQDSARVADAWAGVDVNGLKRLEY